MLVKEIMTKNVVTIDQHASVMEACNKYRDQKVGCLVVTDKESCVGIVTERDLIERIICTHRIPEKTMVKDIMSSNIKTIHPLDTLDEALKVMKTYKIKKLPVLFNDTIVGIITVTDISNARPELSKRFIETWVKPEWED